MTDASEFMRHQWTLLPRVFQRATAINSGFVYQPRCPAVLPMDSTSASSAWKAAVERLDSEEAEAHAVAAPHMTPDEIAE